MVAVTWLRATASATNGVACGCGLGPAVDDAGRGVAAAGGELEPAVGEHPLELMVEQEDRGQRGRVVGLVEARVLERDREVERGWHPTVARRGAARCARSRAASTARATGRRRSRSTSAARSSRRRRRTASTRIPLAPEVPSTTTSASLRSGRCTGTITPVEVSLCGYAYTSPSTWSGNSGRWPGSVSHTCGSSRCGAERGDRGELRRELADHEVRAALLDEAEHGRVPEERRAAVADQHLVAVGQREQLGDARRGSGARRRARRPCGGSCRGSRARRRRARRPLRAAPSTGRSRSARRGGGVSVGISMARVRSPNHDSERRHGSRSRFG